MSVKKEHFVKFYSPGTFCAEVSERPIKSWDVQQACEISKEITERHAAKPYAFVFVTYLVADDVDDGHGGKMKVQPKEVKSSGYYFLGGKVSSFADVVVRNKSDEYILRTNMECNDIKAVVENCNSYKWTQPFDVDDVVVNPDTGNIIFWGSDYAGTN